MTHLIRFLLPLPLVLLILAGGCTGSSRTPCSVSGKITFNGQPVGGGTIGFWPTNEEQHGSYGYSINPDGSYEGAGMPAQDYIVVIETESINQNKPKQDMMGGQNQKMNEMYRQKMKEMGKGGGEPLGTYVKIPSKYGDQKTSDQRVTLKNGKNVCNFDLKE